MKDKHAIKRFQKLSDKVFFELAIRQRNIPDLEIILIKNQSLFFKEFAYYEGKRIGIKLSGRRLKTHFRDYFNFEVRRARATMATSKTNVVPGDNYFAHKDKRYDITTYGFYNAIKNHTKCFITGAVSPNHPFNPTPLKVMMNIKSYKNLSDCFFVYTLLHEIGHTINVDNQPINKPKFQVFNNEEFANQFAATWTKWFIQVGFISDTTEDEIRYIESYGRRHDFYR